MQKVVTVACQEQTAMLMGKLENRFIGGIYWKGFTQERHLVTELFEQVAEVVGHVVVKQESHSDACAICRATSKSISPRWSS